MVDTACRSRSARRRVALLTVCVLAMAGWCAGCGRGPSGVAAVDTVRQAEGDGGPRPCSTVDPDAFGALGPSTVDGFVNGSPLFTPDLVAVGRIVSIRAEQAGEFDSPASGSRTEKLSDEANSRQLFFFEVTQVIAGEAPQPELPIHFESRISNPERDGAPESVIELPCYGPRVGDRLVVSIVDLDKDGVYQLNSPWTGFFLDDDGSLSEELAKFRSESPVGSFELVATQRGKSFDAFVAELQKSAN